jgi:penicillin-binding protein 1B
VALGAGINQGLLATPALALGAYVATPLEIAGAYTIFANQGQFVAPRLIAAVHDSGGQVLWQSPSATRPVLDPRVAYLMVSLMQSVVNSGTGAGVRSRGFTVPAAGKTGTSHDGWFAGFTSNLLAVVWVGYDDDRELHLSGAYSALPVWTEFMKRSVQTPGYSDPQPFAAPAGVITAPIDERSNLVAATGSVTARSEVFVAGTEPGPNGSGEEGAFGILSRIFRSGKVPTVPTAASAPALPLPEGSPPPALGTPGAAHPAPVESEDAAAKKPGIVRRFLSIFKGGSSTPERQPPAPSPNPPSR